MNCYEWRGGFLNKLKETGRALIVELFKQEIQMATTCTEPGAIALASSTARSLAGGTLLGVDVELSRGVLKNSLSVGLPGTARVGPHVAAALGITGGNAELGLEVLKEIKDEHVKEALDLLDRGMVKVTCNRNAQGIYIKVVLTTDLHNASILIQNSHSTITDVTVNDAPLPTKQTVHQKIDLLQTFSFEQIIELISCIEYGEFAYVYEGARSNLSLGRKFEKILNNIGKPQLIAQKEINMPDSLAARIRLLVMAAVSARMEGTIWPVITSAGSGNQGIVVSIPVMLTAELLGAGTNEQFNALKLAHAVNLFIKAFLGEISSSCGAISAGAGVAAAVCWLLGGDYTQMERSVQTVLGTLYTLVCDGAKKSCALKCATSAVEGLIAGLVVMNSKHFSFEGGIVGSTIEETIRTLKLLGEKKLNDLDELLIEAAGY